MKKGEKPFAAWKNPGHVQNENSSRIASSLLRGEELRQRCKEGWALGTFLIELPCTEALTSIALAGFDFVVLDMEHSQTGFGELSALVYAANSAGLAVLVRIWGKDIGLIGKVLDMGAHGVMAPHVVSAERARDVVNEARFAPRGKRGFSPITKYDSLEHPLEELGNSVFVVVQVEGSEALDNIDEIASVPGIDAVFVGPYDLALSMGVEPGSDAVFKEAEKLSGSVPDGVSLGIYIDEPEESANWARRGFSLQCVSFDGRMFSIGARTVATQARAAFTDKR